MNTIYNVNINSGPYVSWRLSINNSLELHHKYINIIEMVANLCPTPSIRHFYFDDSHNESTLCQTDVHNATATLFLGSIFHVAFQRIEQKEDCFSLRGLYWLEYIQTIVKIFVRGCKSSGYNIEVDLDNIKPVTKNDSEVGKLISYIGQQYDIEPPPLKYDLYLKPLVETKIEKWEKLNKPWANEQKRMLHNICSFPMELELYPFLLRDYFKWATGNVNNTDWPQFVPSFNASEDEIEKVKNSNISHKKNMKRLEERSRRLRHEMDLEDEYERKIEEMIKKEGGI